MSLSLTFSVHDKIKCLFYVNITVNFYYPSKVLYFMTSLPLITCHQKANITNCIGYKKQSLVPNDIKFKDWKYYILLILIILITV